MKVSLNWVKQFTDIDLPTDELIKLASERLGGVEGTIDFGKRYEGIVVARVVSCIKHPNADKLRVCMIDDGGIVGDVVRDESGYVKVVCGAPNVREEMLVAWIPPTAIVPSSYGEKELFVLDARELRGELSNGMLASPAELGLSDDHRGILEITDKVEAGTPFKELYDLDDTILEIENKMFTHRPDGFGHIGLAREISGIQHKEFTSPKWYLDASEYRDYEPRQPLESGDQSQSIGVSIEDTGLSQRYMAVALDNIEVKPSPVWLQGYLKRVGVRPINNIVDITNYIMLLTAQPLHAFDFDKIAKNGRVDISVRRPASGEKLTLLDGREIEPHADATLICNPDGPIALGGVMGGANSEVDESTTKIVLECATFDMYNIRKTSMVHGVFTDAVSRLNKGQPAAQLPSVIGRAIGMFKEIAGATIISPVADSNPGTVVGPSVSTSTSFINTRLGSSLSVEEMSSLLTNVEISVEVKGDELTVTPPFWRTDLEIPEDIVEEVGRLHGFNRLPLNLPQRSIAPVKMDSRRALKVKIREILSRAGANEVLTYSFVHGNLIKSAGQDPSNSYALRNALSPDLQYYRQALTPSLLELIRSNIKAGFDEFAVFELNKSHHKLRGDGKDGLPGEINTVALTFASKGSHQSAYYSARRYLDYLAVSLGVRLKYSVVSESSTSPFAAAFSQSRSASVVIAGTGETIGIVGEYDDGVSKKLKLPTASAGFEVSLDHILAAVGSVSDLSYKPLSKYPSTEQDLTLMVHEDLAFSDLHEFLERQLSEIEFDWRIIPLGVFQKEDSTTKNVSFRFTFTHQNRTLTTAEINKLVQQLSWQASEELGAKQV